MPLFCIQAVAKWIVGHQEPCGHAPDVNRTRVRKLDQTFPAMSENAAREEARKRMSVFLESLPSPEWGTLAWVGDSKISKYRLFRVVELKH